MQNSSEYSRWIQRGPSTFIASDNILVRERLPAGAFNLSVERGYNDTKYILNLINIECGNLIDVDQPEVAYINQVIDHFCSKKIQFAELKIAYKTGILMYGVPGGGKTSVITKLIQKVCKMDAVCFVMNNIQDVYSFNSFYKNIYRNIEPDRLIMNIFEDIDGMAGEGETTLINVLDGIGDCNNVINIATTNYTERLSERIINRPGRFDRRVEIKSPSYENRAKYLNLRLPMKFRHNIDLEYWVKETENFTLAQLNEVVKSVLLLDEDFDDIVKKIREMCKIPQSYNFNKETAASVGFRQQN